MCVTNVYVVVVGVVVVYVEILVDTILKRT